MGLEVQVDVEEDDFILGAHEGIEDVQLSHLLVGLGFQSLDPLKVIELGVHLDDGGFSLFKSSSLGIVVQLWRQVLLQVVLEMECTLHRLPWEQVVVLQGQKAAQSVSPSLKFKFACTRSFIHYVAGTAC